MGGDCSHQHGDDGGDDDDDDDDDDDCANQPLEVEGHEAVHATGDKSHVGKGKFQRCKNIEKVFRRRSCCCCCRCCPFFEAQFQATSCKLKVNYKRQRVSH